MSAAFSFSVFTATVVTPSLPVNRKRKQKRFVSDSHKIVGSISVRLCVDIIVGYRNQSNQVNQRFFAGCNVDIIEHWIHQHKVYFNWIGNVSIELYIILCFV